MVSRIECQYDNAHKNELKKQKIQTTKTTF